MEMINRSNLAPVFDAVKAKVSPKLLPWTDEPGSFAE